MMDPDAKRQAVIRSILMQDEYQITTDAACKMTAFIDLIVRQIVLDQAIIARRAGQPNHLTSAMKLVACGLQMELEAIAASITSQKKNDENQNRDRR